MIDTKLYAQRVERRDKGSWFTVDDRLSVGGRDRTKLADGLRWQVEAVRAALGDIEAPVKPVLCLVDGAGWGHFGKPFEIDGVLVTRVRRLAEMIDAPGHTSPTARWR